jgi:hypothetical protein
MPSLSYSPFRTLSEGSPLIATTEKLDDGRLLERNGFVTSYTCDRETCITATANIHASDIFKLLGLSDNSLVALISRADCPKTMYMTSSQSSPFDASKNGDVEVRIVIPKGMIADTLFISYSLVLIESKPSKYTHAAELIGDILWEKSVKFLLEGSGSMFPTSVVEFPPNDGGKLSAWKVDWSRTSLHGSPSRVRLLLNGNNPEFINRVDPENNKEPDKGAIELLHYGVACSILEHAYRKEEELSGDSFESGTLGDFIHRFFSAHFKQDGSPIGTDNVLKRFHQDPESVRSILQANLGFETFRGS